MHFGSSYCMKMNKLVEAKAFEVNNLFSKHFPLSFPITIVDLKKRESLTCIFALM